jgi:hypothetical protein
MASETDDQVPESLTLRLITGHPYAVKFLAPNDLGYTMKFASTLTRIIAELDNCGLWGVTTLHFANGVVINDWQHAWTDIEIAPARG